MGPAGAPCPRAAAQVTTIATATPSARMQTRARIRTRLRRIIAAPPLSDSACPAGVARFRKLAPSRRAAFQTVLRWDSVVARGEFMKRTGHLPMAKLAYRDPDFMESLGARPLRILAEYLDPLGRLRRENVGDTIVMFGSARIKSRGRRNGEWRLKIRTARSILEMSRYYEEARELSRRITSWALTLGNNPKRFVVCSGGGPGIMEAANRGAVEAGGSSLGLSIQLPHEQRPNPYITPELNICFHYFFMRKLWFAQKAKALIVFP